jgi:hypothetical protein
MSYYFETTSSMNAGTTAFFPFSITTNGSPVDLTNYGVGFYANPAFNDGGYTISKSLGQGIDFISPSLGSFYVRIDPSDTSNFTSSALLFYDIIVSDNSGSYYPALNGTLLVKQGMFGTNNALTSFVPPFQSNY